MVSSATILGVCVTLFISLLLPIIVYIVYGVKNKGKGVWSAWLLGAAGFFVFQVIIRLSVLSVLSLSQGFVNFAMEHYVLYSFLLASSAGLFEVAGRYAAARIMSKNLTFERGIAAGLGHGGIEAIVLIGMTYINNLIYIVMINSGSFDAIVEQTAGMGADTSSLIAVKNALISSGSAVFYLAGYERLLTMIFHVALSLLVCYFVMKKKDLYGIVICAVIHGAVDFAAAIVNGMAGGYVGSSISAVTSYVIIYVFLTLVAAASIAGILHLKKRWMK